MIAIKHDCVIHLYLPDPLGEVIYIGLGIWFLKSLSGPEKSYCKKYHVLIPIFTRAQNLIEADDICVPWLYNFQDIDSLCKLSAGNQFT